MKIRDDRRQFINGPTYVALRIEHSLLEIARSRSLKQSRKKPFRRRIGHFIIVILD